MSRVGKLPITIPDSIKVKVNGSSIEFDNGKEKNSYQLNSNIKGILEGSQLKLVAINKDHPDASMFLGMDRSNLKNIISGLQTPFKITLEINGVGYKALVEKSTIVLFLGYSHEIYYNLPSGITAVTEKPNLIIISGSDKVLVGQICAEIISFRSPEPYKGKGVKIFGKKILRKEGKKK